MLVDRKFVTYTELKDDTKKILMKQLACLFSTIKSTVISYVTIFEIIWRQQELYQQISKFEQQIETSEQVNKQLNETIGNLKQQLKF